jgi:hypothetical protein
MNSERALLILCLLAFLIPGLLSAQGPATSPTASSEEIWKDVPDIFYSGQLEQEEPIKPVIIVQPGNSLPPGSETALLPVANPPASGSSGPEEFGPEIATDTPVIPDPGNPTEKKLPVLQGVVITSASEKSVIINGMILNEGDFIEGYTIAQIRKNSVLLKSQREEHVLYVKP